jgi:hypothetical protein
MSDVTGKVGFEEAKKASTDMITKEETMFKVDSTGKAIPERFPVHIYPRDLDKELIEEGLLLMGTIRRNKAINKSIATEMAMHNKNIEDTKVRLEQETDEIKKKMLQSELAELLSAKIRSEVQTSINTAEIEEGIKTSRSIIAELNEEKKKQTMVKYAEIIPCTTAEAYLAFEKNLTTMGDVSSDWVADLISKQVVNPKYSIEEAKLLMPDFKMALKEAIMEASNYKVKSYRDIMLEIKMLEESPLQAKKE